MKKVTTSAQKTIAGDTAGMLKRLESEISDHENITFTPSSHPDVLKASYGDGTLSIAAFDKGDGKSLAMIDHEGVDSSERERWQKYWRDTLDNMFSDDV